MTSDLSLSTRIVQLQGGAFSGEWHLVESNCERIILFDQSGHHYIYDRIGDYFFGLVAHTQDCEEPMDSPDFELSI